MLPVVKPGVVQSVDARRRFDRQSMVTMKAEMAAENPHLAAVTEEFCSVVEDPVWREMAVYAGVYVYHLLRSQAGADQLSREIHGRMK